MRHTDLPGEFHFYAIKTHVLERRPLGTETASDIIMILDALYQGHCFIGYDLPAHMQVFNFIAHGVEFATQIGDELNHNGRVTFQIHLPKKTKCILFKDGKPLHTWQNHDLCTDITVEPGVYR